MALFPNIVSSVVHNFKYPINDFPKQSIVMRIFQYKKPGFNVSPSTTLLSTIRLPIPKNVIDTLTENYSEENLGPIVGSAIQGVQQIINGNLTSAAASTVATGVAALASTPTGIVDLAARAALGGRRGAMVSAAIRNLPIGDTGALTSGLSALTGMLFNPFQTVLFKNPNFKTFQFEWLFTPKDASESKRIKDIITYLQYHMSPELGAGFTGGTGTPTNLIMGYPDIVRIEFLTLDNKNEFMPKLKDCVIKNLSVNYVPTSVPTFFKDTNAPTAVRISMQLQEIEIWTKESLIASIGS